MENVTLPCRLRLLTSLPPWTGPDDFSLLSQYVMTHFLGDWVVYTAFVHWADSQRLEFPGEPIHVETWLSMKTSLGIHQGLLWLLRQYSAAVWEI